MKGYPSNVEIVELNTVANALRNIAREMSINLRRCAHSVIIREGKDYVTGILDKNGQLVSQAEHNPVMVNSLLLSFQACLKETGLETIGPDDVLITNPDQHGLSAILLPAVAHGAAQHHPAARAKGDRTRGRGNAGHGDDQNRGPHRS